MATDIDRGQQAAAEDTRRYEREPGAGARAGSGQTNRPDYGKGDYDFGTQRDSYLLAGYQAGQNLQVDDDYQDEDDDNQDTILTRGPMTGRGPKNYRRADERIREDVCERLTEHGQIDAGDLEVKVVDGQVVLNGTVNRREEKWLAEDVAEDVPGVREVRNEIRVRRPYDQGRGGVVGTFREAPAEQPDRTSGRRASGQMGDTDSPGRTLPGQAS